MKTLNGHKHSITCLDFSPDGKWLGSSCLGGKAIVWEVASGKEVFRKSIDKTNMNAIRFHPTDGTVFMGCYDGRVRVWELNKPLMDEPKTTYREPSGDQGITRVVIDRNGTRMLTGIGMGKAVLLWELKTGIFKQYLPEGGRVSDVAFAPSGKTFVVSHLSETVSVWDIDKEKSVGQFKTGDLVLRVCYSPDGKYIATGSREAIVQVWDTETFKKVGETTEHRDNISGLQFTPDVKYLLSCCGYSEGNEELRIWDVVSKKDMGKFAPHKMGCVALAISPDGKRLATAAYNGEIRVWDLGAILAEIKK